MYDIIKASGCVTGLGPFAKVRPSVLVLDVKDATCSLELLLIESSLCFVVKFAEESFLNPKKKICAVLPTFPSVARCSLVSVSRCIKVSEVCSLMIGWDRCMATVRPPDLPARSPLVVRHLETFTAKAKERVWLGCSAGTIGTDMALSSSRSAKIATSCMV